jgi:hypothetical protein
MSSSEASPAGAPVAAKGLGVVPLLLTSPAEAFRRLGADPQWIGPFVLYLVLALAATWIRMPQDLVYQYEVAEQMFERLGMSGEEMDEALAAMPDPESLTPGRAALHVAPAAAVLALFGFLGALVYWVLARLLGPQPTFRRALSAYWTANLAAGFGYLVLAIVVRLSDTIEVSLGPAALIPGLSWGSLPQLILDVFNVFSLVLLYFLAVGARWVFPAPKGTAWAIAGVSWGISAMVTLATEIFGSWASGRL